MIDITLESNYLCEEMMNIDEAAGLLLSNIVLFLQLQLQESTSGMIMDLEIYVIRTIRPMP